MTEIRISIEIVMTEIRISINNNDRKQNKKQQLQNNFITITINICMTIHNALMTCNSKNSRDIVIAVYKKGNNNYYRATIVSNKLITRPLY